MSYYQINSIIKLLVVASTVVGVGSPNCFAQTRLRAPSQQGAGKEHVLQQLELKKSTIYDGARLISELSGVNVVATEEAGEKEVTLYLRHIRAIDAIETMARVAGLWYREDDNTGTIRILTTQEYQDDLIVQPDDMTRVFTLRHPNALSIAQSIRSLYGPRVMLSMQLFDDDILVGTTGMLGGGRGMMGLSLIHI